MDTNIKDVTVDIKSLEVLTDGEKFKVSIRIPMNIGWVDDMFFLTKTRRYTKAYKIHHTHNDGEYAYFEGEVDLPTSALNECYFKMKINNGYMYVKRNGNSTDEVISPYNSFKISSNFKSPDWAKGAVMYHIFVDRFNKGKETTMEEMPNRTIKDWFDPVLVGPDEQGRWNVDFYGGNLEGIEERLDYLYSLGVDILYLSPIFLSQSNHGYDTGDYEQIDPYKGTWNDLKALCDAAHKKGMKVIIDGVFNHVGNDSKYYNEYGTYPEKGAFQGKDSKYFPFFKTFEHNGRIYYSFWFGLPNVIETNTSSTGIEWEEYICGRGGIIDKIFAAGVDGLRIDVGDSIDDYFHFKMTEAVKRNKPDGLIIDEVWDNPMRQNRGYLDTGKGMHSVMNYLLVDALIRYFKYNDKGKLQYIINQILEEYPEETINTLMNFTSTHDISRAINIFGTDDFNMYGQYGWTLKNDSLDFCRNRTLTEEEKKIGKEVFKAYAFTLAFLPGIMSIFYGDEIGIEGAGNLANRKPYPYGEEDHELLEFFKDVIHVRKKEDYLRTASLKIIDINDEYFMFERTSNNTSILVTVNKTDREISINLPKEYESSTEISVLNGYNDNMLTPFGGVVLKKVNNN